MPAPLKFTKEKKIKLPYSSGANYPEIFLIIISAFSIAIQCEFMPAISILLMGMILVSAVVFFLSYTFGVDTNDKNDTRLTTVILVLMSLILGFAQFNLIITLCFTLLIAIRLILSAPEHRLRLFSYSLAGALSAAFLGKIFFDYGSPQTDNIEMAVILSTVFITLWQFYIAQYNRRWADEQFGEAQKRMNTMVSVINKLTRYLPPQVWQPIIRYDAPVAVSNKRTKLTVMFSDIAGFTALSEKLSADDVADILNTYMERMTLIAQRYDAVLDKFIGDGMVCFFGAPNSKGIREDALTCTAMAIDMRREMRTLRHQWRLQGFEGLYIRIGITTGYCHVGNFGSDSRMSYTLIGSEANLAARLEAAAKNSDILVSQATYDYICHEYPCVFQGRIKLKGFEESVRTYTVMDPDVDEKAGSKWVDYNLPGFNLHLNFQDIKNYDYRVIKEHLNQALEKVEKIEKDKKDGKG